MAPTYMMHVDSVGDLMEETEEERKGRSDSREKLQRVVGRCSSHVKGSWQVYFLLSPKPKKGLIF